MLSDFNEGRKSVYMTPQPPQFHLQAGAGLRDTSVGSHHIARTPHRSRANSALIMHPVQAVVSSA
jgi:hypothetical protein